MRPEGCRSHGVDRSCFQKRGLEILSTLARLLRVMVDAPAVCMPEEAMPGGDSEAAVDAWIVQRGKDLINLASMREGRRALEKHQFLGQRFLLFQNLQGVKKG